MTRTETSVCVLVLLGALEVCGCQHNFLVSSQDDLRRLPPVLPPSPTLAQVVAVVNGNSSRIQSFSTSQATISGTGFPAMRASIAFQRPMRLRLRADLPLGTGQAVDVGSNDELFWFWARSNEPPAVYYCRHGQFATSPARRGLPIDPYWLVEALGLVQLDPALPHQGPHATRDGRLEIRTVVPAEQGSAMKVTIVDARQGVVLAQYLFDARSQLVASAIAGRYRRDPLSGLLMPTNVEIHTAATPATPAFSLRIDMSNLEINRPIPNAEQLWAMPTFENSAAIDLCDPARQPLPAPSPGRQSIGSLYPAGSARRP